MAEEEVVRKPNVTFLTDIIEKMNIARNIVLTLAKNRDFSYYKFHDSADKVAIYTKRDLYFILKVMRSLKPLRKHNEVLKEQKKNILTYEIVRGKLHKMYVIKRILPVNSFSITKLLTSGEILNTELHHLGFVWLGVPNTNKYILTEKIKNIHERQIFLKKMIDFRNANRNIVYMTIRPMNNFKLNRRVFENDPTVQNVILVATREKILYHIFCQEVKKSYLKRLFHETILDLLPPSSVIVLTHSQYDKDIMTPTVCSTKKEMLNWLEHHKVYHDPTAHRAELFTLINKFSKALQSQEDKVYSVINSRGHDIIRNTTGLEDLYFFRKFTEHILEFCGPLRLKRNIFVDGQKTFLTADFQESEYELIKMEERIYIEDLEMEIVIDQLMTMAIDGGFSSNKHLLSGLSVLPNHMYFSNFIL